MKMKKHFVVFFSPGTFLAEQSEKPIDAWDVKTALAMVLSIKERHGATPYAFQFITRERTEAELDSRTTKHSGFYFLGGKILTVKDLEKRADPKDSILISNMKFNRWKRVVENRNSWKWVQPLEKGDKVLDFTPQAK